MADRVWLRTKLLGVQISCPVRDAKASKFIEYVFTKQSDVLLYRVGKTFKLHVTYDFTVLDTNSGFFITLKMERWNRNLLSLVSVGKARCY